jgi:hypothetical protein
VSPALLVALWLMAISVFAYFVFIVEPRRGVDFSADEGWFLYKAWAAVSGFGGDPLLPQAPHYLFNAALMAMGIESIWTLIVAHHALNAAAITAFMSSVDDRGLRSPLVPLTVAMGQAINLNTILNHYTVPIFLALLGLGVLLWGERVSGRRGCLLKCLALCILGAAAVANFAIGVAISIAVGVFFFLDRSSYKSALAAFYLGLIAIFLICYWHWIGSDVIFNPPVARDASLSALFKRARRIVSFFVEVAAFFAVAMLVARSTKTPERLGTALVFFQSAGICLLSVVLIAYLLRIPIGSGFVWNALWTSSGDVRFILIALPFVGMFQLVVAVLAGVLHEVETKSGQLPRHSWGNMSTWLAAMPTLHRMEGRLIVASIALLTMFSVGSVGSNTHILLAGIYVTGCAIGLALTWLDWLDGLTAKTAPALACLWFGVILIFGSTYNHSSGYPIFGSDSIPFSSGPLAGIRGTAQHHRSLDAMHAAYSELGCRRGVLIPLDYTPLLPFLLRHPTPERMGAIRPAFYFPGDEIRRVLSNADHWCVIYATGVETAGYIEAVGWDPRSEIIDWIHLNAKASLSFSSPDKLFTDDFKILAGGINAAGVAPRHRR